MSIIDRIKKRVETNRTGINVEEIMKKIDLMNDDEKYKLHEKITTLELSGAKISPEVAKLKTLLDPIAQKVFDEIMKGPDGVVTQGPSLASKYENAKVTGAVVPGDEQEHFGEI